jgi:hypothetical protein
LFGLRKKSPPRPPDVLPGICSLEDAYAGIILTGSPGGGKTATAGRQIRRHLLGLGCGGINMCAKPGEFEQLQRDCELMGRTDDLVEFIPGGEESVDILNVELSAPGGTFASAASLIDLMAEMDGRMKGRGTGDGDGKYWSDMNSKGFRHAIAACWLVNGSCSLVDVYKMFATAPTSPDQVADPKWHAGSFCWRVLREGMQKCPNNCDFALAATFFVNEWANLSEKTRSICVSVATNLLDRFMSGPMMQMVASGITTNGPESTLAGKILAPNMPVLRYQEQGILFANVLKTLVQRTVLRRDTGGNPLPVFIFADEAQFFMIPDQDMMVSTVARESRLIQVNIFQNLPMLFAALGGGDRATQQVYGWMSCHHTNIALANTCVTSGDYFSKLYGSSWQDVWSESIPTGGGGPYSLSADLYGQEQQGGGSLSRHPQLLPDVPPESFGRLHRPSPSEPWANGYVFQGGRIYPETGRPWKMARFPWLAPGPLPKRKPAALTFAPVSRIRTTLPPQLEPPSGR